MIGCCYGLTAQFRMARALPATMPLMALGLRDCDCILSTSLCNMLQVFRLWPRALCAAMIGRLCVLAYLVG
eukprot:75350-Amorphochlora_amoeboformis.AAC.1